MVGQNFSGQNGFQQRDSRRQPAEIAFLGPSSFLPATLIASKMRCLLPSGTSGRLGGESMFRYGSLAVALCLLLTSAFSQSPSQINSTSVVGFWSNAANPNEHFELRADGQFAIDENGQHLEGAWDLNGYTLTLHFSPSLVGKAQWDGHAFIDNQQKHWVRATLTSTAPSQPVASPPVSASATPAPQGQSGDQKALLQQTLNSQFRLTKTTADKNDIVTPGAVLVLQKDGLLMCSLDTPVPPTSNYKNGKISMGFGSDLAWSMQLGRNSSEVPQRKFVAGEKFWVTGLYHPGRWRDFQVLQRSVPGCSLLRAIKVSLPKTCHASRGPGVEDHR